MDTLFAYGTLMRDERLHHILAERLEAACPARCVGRLLDMGAFPAMVEDDCDHTAWVQGELLLVRDLLDLLPRLDRIEGCAPGGRGLYRRERRSVALGGVQNLDAWVYLLAEGVERGPEIQAGAWRARTFYRVPEPRTPLQGLDEVLRMMAWRCEEPGSAPLLARLDRPPPRETWGGADLLVTDLPHAPMLPEEDWWGKFSHYAFVATPHALALGWLIVELMDRVLWRGLRCDKYTFFRGLGTAALSVLADQPHAGERTLLSAVWCEAARMVTCMGWDRE
jgi:gamma-glutamylcyclotransferase (GGCT)/AIG2-like uncharacterized protein YtfP